MNNTLRLGLFAASALAVLSLAACKTTDDMSQDSAPAAQPAPPAPTDTSTMPTPTSTMPPADTGTAPPTTP